jgi:hypothetical protein
MAQHWVTALRTNDLAGAYLLLTPTDQARAEREWQLQATARDAYVDMQLNVVLTMANEPNGVELLTNLIKPQLAQVNPQILSNQVNEIAGFLGMAAATQQPGTTPSLDYAGLNTWLKDVAAFIPQADLTNPTKLSQAMGHLVNAIRATTLRDAAEARNLNLEQLLKRISPALADAKQALAVYDIQVNALLESFTFTLSELTPHSGTLTISFTALGKPRSFPVKLVIKNGSWQLTDGADNPIAALSQLVMMSLIMHSMGAGAPAQQPPAPINDGAL